MGQSLCGLHQGYYMAKYRSSPWHRGATYGGYRHQQSRTDMPGFRHLDFPKSPPLTSAHTSTWNRTHLPWSCPPCTDHASSHLSPRIPSLWPCPFPPVTKKPSLSLTRPHPTPLPLCLSWQPARIVPRICPSQSQIPFCPCSNACASEGGPD